MIKIEIPEFDYEVQVDSLSVIPYNTPGVYTLYDKNNSLMYVGKASDLRNRISGHFRGRTNTGQYIWSIQKCKAFVEENSAHRGIYELFLIDKYQPPLNNQFNVKQYQGQNLLMRQASIENLHPAFCKFIIKEGRQCAKNPLSNGFCHLHGGIRK